MYIFSLTIVVPNLYRSLVYLRIPALSALDHRVFVARLLLVERKDIPDLEILRCELHHRVATLAVRRLSLITKCGATYSFIFVCFE